MKKWVHEDMIKFDDTKTSIRKVFKLMENEKLVNR